MMLPTDSRAVMPGIGLASSEAREVTLANGFVWYLFIAL